VVALRVGPVETLRLFFSYKNIKRVTRVTVLHHPAEGSRAFCHVTIAKPETTAGLEDVPDEGYRMDPVTCPQCKRRFRIERSTLRYDAGAKPTGTFRALLAGRR